MDLVDAKKIIIELLVRFKTCEYTFKMLCLCFRQLKEHDKLIENECRFVENTVNLQRTCLTLHYRESELIYCGHFYFLGFCYLIFSSCPVFLIFILKILAAEFRFEIINGFSVTKYMIISLLDLKTKISLSFDFIDSFYSQIH